MARPCCLLLTLASGGCSLAPKPLPPAGTAPLDFVAWLCADTCRVEFPAADPLPYHAGAPATRLPDGSYEIRYERRRDGRWTPRATGRLVPVGGQGAALPQVVRHEATAGLPGFRSVDATIAIHVVASIDGPTVRVWSGGCDATPLQQHLSAAVAFAAALARRDEDGDRLRSCCAHHAPWRAVALLRRANDQTNAGALVAARDALRSAHALWPALASLDWRLGELDRALGHDGLASVGLRAASRRHADPALRTAASLSAAAVAARNLRADAADLRRAALAAVRAQQPDSAAALAQAAAAKAPDRIADLRLQRELQHARADRAAALGTALLLREYGDATMQDHELARDLAAAGHWDLARRADLRALAGSAWNTAAMATLRARGEHLARELGRACAEARALAAPPR